MHYIYGISNLIIYTSKNKQAYLLYNILLVLAHLKGFIYTFIEYFILNISIMHCIKILIK